MRLVDDRLTPLGVGPHQLPRVRAPDAARPRGRRAARLDARAERAPTPRDLVARKGDEHERRYLESLRAAGTRGGRDRRRRRGWTASSTRRERTLEAMRAGAEVIYQGAFLDGDAGAATPTSSCASTTPVRPRRLELRGRRHQARPPRQALLPAPALLLHASWSPRIQGREPEQIHVMLGTGEQHSFRARRVRRLLPPDQAALPRRDRRLAARHLPGPGRALRALPLGRALRRAARRRRPPLPRRRHAQRADRCASSDAGITTARSSSRSRRRRHRRPEASRRPPSRTLRAPGAPAARPAHAPASPPTSCSSPRSAAGFALLPPPSEGDLFFDMEGDPFYEDGLEYLFGVDLDRRRRAALSRLLGPRPRRGEARVRGSSSTSSIERRERYPDLHVYHYAPYEPTALKRLMGLHAHARGRGRRPAAQRACSSTSTAVVAQGMRISQPSYSIKKVEAFYMASATRPSPTASDSIVAFEQWLDDGRRRRSSTRSSDYNEEDCVSTLTAARLAARAARRGGGDVRPRDRVARRPRSWEPDEALEEATETDRLREALLAGVPEDLAERDRRAARALAAGAAARLPPPRGQAGLVGVLRAPRHADRGAGRGRRGARRTSTRSPASKPRGRASSSLDLHARVSRRRSTSSAPAATSSIPRPEAAVDVDRDRRRQAGIVEIRRGPRARDEPLPRGADPRHALRHRARSARRCGGSAPTSSTDGLDGAGPLPRRCATILRRDCRASTRSRPGAPLQGGGVDLEQAKRIAAGLDDSYLFIQGPPGSGKTYTGAHLIVHLLARGKRVGVTVEQPQGDPQPARTRSSSSRRGAAPSSAA